MAFYKQQFNRQTGVWYPQAVIVGKPIETKQIAERLSQISTVSKSDVAAVLGDLAEVIADYMAQGKSVHLDGLGTFHYKLHTTGVNDRAEFDFQKQVNAVRVQFTPERRGGGIKGVASTRALVSKDIEWVELEGQQRKNDLLSDENNEDEGIR